MKHHPDCVHANDYPIACSCACGYIEKLEQEIAVLRAELVRRDANDEKSHSSDCRCWSCTR